MFKSSLSKIMIGGLGASGKTTICHLLDGHPQICSATTFSLIIQLFYNQSYSKTFIERKLPRRDEFIERSIRAVYQGSDLKWNCSFEQFLLMLTNLRAYVRQETYAFIRKAPVESSYDDGSGAPFNFDFQKFENQWKQQLFSQNRTFYAEEIYDILLKCFTDAWQDYPTNLSDTEHCAGVIPRHNESVEFLLKEKMNVKIIFSVRSFEGILLTKALLVLRNYQRSSQGPITLDQAIKKILRTSFLQQEIESRNRVEQLAKIYPQKIYLLRFEDLLSDVVGQMNKLADFLGIRKDELLYHPTFGGHPLHHRCIAAVNDDQWGLKPATQKVIQHYINEGPNLLNTIRSMDLKSQFHQKYKDVVRLFKKNGYTKLMLQDE